jgi:hypothetical protein
MFRPSKGRFPAPAVPAVPEFSSRLRGEGPQEENKSSSTRKIQAGFFEKPVRNGTQTG